MQSFQLVTSDIYQVMSPNLIISCDGNNHDRCVMWVNSFGIYDVLYSTSQSTVMSYAVESGC